MMTLSALLALTLMPSAMAGTPTWAEIQTAGWGYHATREHDAAGTVQVYTKTVAGITCLQGVATAAYSPEQLMDVAADIEGTLDWSSAGVTEGVTMARSASQIDYYQYLDVPGWTMASDRFWFLRGHFVKTATSYVLHWDRMGDGGGPYADRFQQFVAAHPDAIEPPTNVGGWVFTTTDEGTRIQYYICSDTGGTIPMAVQIAASKRTLPDTVGDVVREAARRAK
jgi:hypothetical protein